MSHQCRIEFYFKKEDLQRLLTESGDAKGIIISQEIRKEKPKGAEHYVNVTHITARPDKSNSVSKAAGGEDVVEGCPYPPGCN